VLCNEVVRNKRPPSSSVAIIFVYMVSLVAWQQRARAIFLLPSANQTIQGTNGQNKQGITDKNQEERDKAITRLSS